LEKDLNAADMNIRPAADPGSVTKSQKLAKAQFLLQTGQNNPVVNQHELMQRVYEAADIEDIEKLLPEPDPNAPPPPELVKAMSEAKNKDAQSDLYAAQADETRAKTALIGFNVGKETGLAGGAAPTGASAGEPDAASEPAAEREMEPA
jgi:hypothetical protein